MAGCQGAPGCEPARLTAPFCPPLSRRDPLVRPQSPRAQSAAHLLPCGPAAQVRKGGTPSESELGLRRVLLRKAGPLTSWTGRRPTSSGAPWTPQGNRPAGPSVPGFQSSVLVNGRRVTPPALQDLGLARVCPALQATSEGPRAEIKSRPFAHWQGEGQRADPEWPPHSGGPGAQPAAPAFRPSWWASGKQA